ncbi:MAG: hypothetical protein ACD_62C00263G0002 [uncultured bacterium]|nr:MAG: hypothetical protein ACD_62C00263G0002 [uncultured bacterium]
MSGEKIAFGPHLLIIDSQQIRNRSALQNVFGNNSFCLGRRYITIKKTLSLFFDFDKHLFIAHAQTTCFAQGDFTELVCFDELTQAVQNILRACGNTAGPGTDNDLGHKILRDS